MKRNTIYLQHIIEEINFITNETKNLTYESFVQSQIFTRAFSRSLEIIGEAVKNLSPDFKQSHPNIDWKKMSGMRDKLIHHYFGIDFDLLWDVVENKLPELADKINLILIKSEDNEKESAV